MAKRAINYRPAVASYASLPIAANTFGDIRVVRDTGIQYWWTIAAAVGARTDWQIFNDKIPSTIDEQEKLNLELELEFKAAVLSRYSEYTYVGKVESIHDIAKQNGVDVSLKQKISVQFGKPSSFRESAGNQVFKQLILHQRSQFSIDS